jgi:hypothetical protein
MFRNTLQLYIDALLIKKDNEIEDNFFQIHELFIKYCHNEINKEYLFIKPDKADPTHFFLLCQAPTQLLSFCQLSGIISIHNICKHP